MTKTELFKVPFNLQFFAEGDEGGEGAGDGAGSISNVEDLNTLLDGLQAGDTGTADEGAQKEEEGATGDEGTAGAGETGQADTNKPDLNTSKMNLAFGQMRKENKELQSTLLKVAKAYGIDANNTKEVLEKLNQDVLTKQAEQQKVPVELLSRMQTLEEQNNAFLEAQRQQALTNGFITLATEYNLDEKALTSFASELDAAGFDLVSQDIDIVQLYKSVHADDIIAAKVKAGIEQALKKSNEADTHSTIPGKNQNAGGGGTQTKIENMAQLNSFLDGLGK